jgi:hypothetical protein
MNLFTHYNTKESPPPPLTTDGDECITVYGARTIFFYFHGGARKIVGTTALHKPKDLVKVKCRFLYTGTLVSFIHRHIK